MSKKGLIMIIIGIILLAVDIYIPMGETYPAMVEAKDLGEVLQGKIIDHFIGTQPKVDVVPDVLGYLFVLIGCLCFIKKDIRFILAIIFIPIAVYYQINLPQLPYHLEARQLYLSVAGQNFLAVGAEIAVEFFVIHGLIKLTDCRQNKWNQNELLVAWILAMISKGLLVGINFFFGMGVLYYAYSIVVIGATIVYLNRLSVVWKFKAEGNA